MKRHSGTCGGGGGVCFHAIRLPGGRGAQICWEASSLRYRDEKGEVLQSTCFGLTSLLQKFGTRVSLRWERISKKAISRDEINQISVIVRKKCILKSLETYMESKHVLEVSSVAFWCDLNT